MNEIDVADKLLAVSYKLRAGSWFASCVQFFYRLAAITVPNLAA